MNKKFEVAQSSRRRFTRVEIVHLANRSCLIRTRLTGAKIANEPTLIFLDAHIEVTVGRLEPIMARINENSLRRMSPFMGGSRNSTFANITSVNYDFYEDIFVGTSNLAKDFISRLFVTNSKISKNDA
uniref:Glycosyltransferase 2-like domain-containing protein n=1 Tax=Romanomermis culicivorax TaxID=13658 RepID=A0A915L5B7_ROMCU